MERGGGKRCGSVKTSRQGGGGGAGGGGGGDGS